MLIDVLLKICTRRRNGGRDGEQTPALNVVVRKCLAILELLSKEDSTSMVGRDTASCTSEAWQDGGIIRQLTILVLDLSLVVVKVSKRSLVGSRHWHGRWYRSSPYDAAEIAFMVTENAYVSCEAKAPSGKRWE